MTFCSILHSIPLSNYVATLFFVYVYVCCCSKYDRVFEAFVCRQFRSRTPEYRGEREEKKLHEAKNVVDYLLLTFLVISFLYRELAHMAFEISSKNYHLHLIYEEIIAPIHSYRFQWYECANKRA